VQDLGKWLGKLSYLPRVLSIAFVMATVLAFFGVIAGMIALFLVNLPSTQPASNYFWLFFVGVALMVGSLMIYAFYRELSGGKGSYRQQIIAAFLVFGLGVILLTMEAVNPSNGSGTPGSVLVASLVFNVLSIGIFWAFEWARRDQSSQGKH
jgi:hypothetical protein